MGWGNGNWGEMIWRGATAVPALSFGGFVLLAVTLASLGTVWIVRRRRSERSS